MPRHHCLIISGHLSNIPDDRKYPLSQIQKETSPSLKVFANIDK